MYDTILVPFDGSKEARKGAQHGIELAAALGSTIHALYVIDLPGHPRTVYLSASDDEMKEEYQEYAEEVTAELCEMAEKAGVDCVTAIRTGKPAEDIVEYADEEEMDAIVIGSAYRGKFRALLGSTADNVIRTSRVPVITTRTRFDE
ncbi:universal stress protein [Salinigranum salinum]|uniref:universal stress protein n=1 Tax=Salinigranum salinum TaxID=1364937 RepID=UPI0012612EFD|nr:universal stress protein [Salinigranum salinum]